MLKKLKLRLILHNMLILAFVFSLLFVAFSCFIYIREETKITNALKENIDQAKNIFSENHEEIPSMEDLFHTFSFAVPAKSVSCSIFLQ